MGANPSILQGKRQSFDELALILQKEVKFML